MLYYLNNDTNKHYIFIHIPKNAGHHFRRQINSDPQNCILARFWNIVNNFDRAHIPYVLRYKYIYAIHPDCIYYAYSRNPYDRLISAYFYLNNKDTNKDTFNDFCKNVLPTLANNFNFTFFAKDIHYYPQYLFVCDQDKNVYNVRVDKLEHYQNPKKYTLSDFYDNDSIQIVNTIYEKDFLLFNYDIVTNI
jgi:hypothetical protein